VVSRESLVGDFGGYCGGRGSTGIETELDRSLLHFRLVSREDAVFTVQVEEIRKCNGLWTKYIHHDWQGIN
jgi:hypothetical protein